MELFKLWLHGATGRMGTEIQNLLKLETEFLLVGGSAEGYWAKFSNNCLVATSYEKTQAVFKEAEIFIDFSSPNGNDEFFKTINRTTLEGKAILIATTGLSEDQRTRWSILAQQRNLKVLFASNTSYGIILVSQICQELAKQLHGLGFDIELSETHHRAKLDSPSGTAKYLATRLANQEKKRITYCRTGARSEEEIGVTAIRGGSVFGEHTIRFLGEHEEIAITHRAMSRTLFAQGALILSKWLLKQSSKVYSLEDVFLN